MPINNLPQKQKRVKFAAVFNYAPRLEVLQRRGGVAHALLSSVVVVSEWSASNQDCCLLVNDSSCAPQSRFGCRDEENNLAGAENRTLIV